MALFGKQLLDRQGTACFRVQNGYTQSVGWRGGEFLEKIWKRLLHARGIFESYSGNFQSQNCEAHSHSVVIVSFDLGAMELRWEYSQGISSLNDSSSAAGQFGL